MLLAPQSVQFLKNLYSSSDVNSMLMASGCGVADICLPRTVLCSVREILFSLAPTPYYSAKIVILIKVLIIKDVFICKMQ